MAVISVFCGSRTGKNPTFAEESRQIARGLVRAGHTIVYGGGSTGIMGAVADAALDLGGSVIGVIPECLATVELMHSGVSDMRVVPDMHARKQLMHDLTDAYAVLPGGYGTMEEAFEAITWSQLRIHRSPTGILNSGSCYDALESLFNSMLSNDFIDNSSRDLVHFSKSVDRLLDWLQGSLGQTSV
ncbi:MAG: TIGR00730 family Rossman fold protein [Fuerstiella sp.]|nr:TIGR00730 family Rossman fold protein [Fuerstiella sp.]